MLKTNGNKSIPLKHVHVNTEVIKNCFIIINEIIYKQWVHHIQLI